MLVLRVLAQRGAAVPVRSVRPLSTAVQPGAKKKQYHNEPSLRVRVVPMFADNYGTVVVSLFYCSYSRMDG